VRTKQQRRFSPTVFAFVAVLTLPPALQGGATSDQRGVAPVGQPGAAASGGKYYALVIGINDYRDLPKLRTPLSDAQAVATLLRTQYGFQTKLLPNATRDQILTALDEYRRTLSPESDLLIYYAGHGYYDKDEDRAYWAPVDAQRDTYARWIIAEEITGVARAIPARHVLILSDSCYSGMLTRAASPTVTPIEHDAYIQKMEAGKSRDVMSSGGNEPVADGDAPGHSSDHSVFANALLQGLTRIDLPEFSADELFSHQIREQVGGRSNQVPEYSPIRGSGHEEGDFVFVRLGAHQKTSATTSTTAKVEGTGPGSAGTTSGPVVVKGVLQPGRAGATDLPAGGAFPRWGGLMLSAPAGTQVSLDGRPVGTIDATGSLFLNQVAVGNHVVKFQSGTYVSPDKPVTIMDGQQGMLRWDFSPAPVSAVSTVPTAASPQQSPKALTFDVSLKHGSKGTLTIGSGSIQFSGSKGSFVSDLATATCGPKGDGFYVRTKDGKEYEFRSTSNTPSIDICDAIRKAAVAGDPQQRSASLVPPANPK